MRKRIKVLLDLETFDERQVQRDLQRLVWAVKWNTRQFNKKLRLTSSEKNEKILGDGSTPKAEQPLEPTG